ncbi:MAG: hypothetical protein MZV70_49045 [Desulfobacterales bacterium]|nr:hypothetical protein [Desulfobacterales bacterium]
MSVYRVGKLGRFGARDLSLRPGTYIRGGIARRLPGRAPGARRQTRSGADPRYASSAR